MTVTSKQREYHDFFQLPEEGKIKMSNTKARFDLAGWLRANSMNKAYKMLDDNFSVTSVTSVNSYLDDHHPNDHQSMELSVQRSIDATYSLDKVLKRNSLDENQHLYLPKKDVSIDEWRFQGKQSETI